MALFAAASVGFDGGFCMRVEFTLVFRVDAADEGEARERLRGLLKVAGRRFGMRAAEMARERVVPPEEMRAVAGEGKGFVCPGWWSNGGQGRFWCGRIG